MVRMRSDEMRTYIRTRFMTLKLIFAVLALLCSGCKTAQVAADNTPSIRLEKAETRHSGIATVHFPGGLYTPDFQTDEGVYYKAEKKLVVRELGNDLVLRGGLF